MKKHRLMIAIILGMVMITMLPFFFHTPLLGHDELFHLSNIEVLSRYLSLDSWKQGFHIIPEIANHLGYGIGIFYPILPHLFGAIIYKVLSLFGLPSIITIYVIYFIVIALASIVIYFISLEVQKEKKIALLSSIFYMTMPYILSDLWIRFSLNEIFLLLFFPMIILSLIKLLKQEYHSFYFLFIIGYIGMITSHLVMTLYMTLLLIPFGFIYRKKLFQLTTIVPLLKAIGIVSIFVLPNIILFFQHWITGNYIAFQDNVMTSLSLVQSEALQLSDYIVQTTNYDWTCAFHIPIILIILFLISCFYIIREKKREMGYLLFLFVISFLMMSPIFPWQFLPNMFWMIQFPWRLEIALLLPLSIIAPLCLSRIKRFNMKKWLYIVLILIYFIFQLPFLHKLLNRPYQLQDYTYTVNDAMGHQQEYLPIEALNTWETRDEELRILNGNATSGIIKNDITMQFYVKDIEEGTTVELPRLYYLGYTLKDEYGNHYHYTKSSDGYMEFIVGEEGKYTLTYTGTIMYQIVRVARMVLIVGLFIFFIRMRKLGNKRKNMI